MAGSKAGRRKKPGPRYPSGKLVQGEEDLPGHVLWQRELAAARTKYKDPRFSDEVGRLHLDGRLTAEERTAIDRIRGIIAAWHRLEGLRASPASPSFEAGRGRSLSADNPKAYRKAKREWERLQGCYRNALERSTIERLLCDGEAIVPPMTLALVKSLLLRVSVAFNLRESRGSVRGMH